jgi:hypothetical protein
MDVILHRVVSVVIVVKLVSVYYSFLHLPHEAQNITRFYLKYRLLYNINYIESTS